MVSISSGFCWRGSVPCGVLYMVVDISRGRKWIFRCNVALLTCRMESCVALDCTFNRRQ